MRHAIFRQSARLRFSFLVMKDVSGEPAPAHFSSWERSNLPPHSPKTDHGLARLSPTAPAPRPLSRTPLPARLLPPSASSSCAGAGGHSPCCVRARDSGAREMPALLVEAKQEGEAPSTREPSRRSEAATASGRASRPGGQEKRRCGRRHPILKPFTPLKGAGKEPHGCARLRRRRRVSPGGIWTAPASPAASCSRPSSPAPTARTVSRWSPVSGRACRPETKDEVRTRMGGIGSRGFGRRSAVQCKVLISAKSSPHSSL